MKYNCPVLNNFLFIWLLYIIIVLKECDLGCFFHMSLPRFHLICPFACFVWKGALLLGLTWLSVYLVNGLTLVSVYLV